MKNKLGITLLKPRVTKKKQKTVAVKGMAELRPKIFQCGKKFQYKTKLNARNFAIKMDVTLRVYQCPHCYFWHVGHEGRK